MRKLLLIGGIIFLSLSTVLFRANEPSPGLAPGARADRILVSKSSHTLTLYQVGRVLKVYKVALGRGNGSAKQRKGDHETPEGSYVIDRKNSLSRFHLALHVSYPNSSDKANAMRLGVPAGGDIMIHGIGRGLGWLGSLQHDRDWTDGCIALTNSEIDEVWQAVPVGTAVEIRH